MSLSITNRADMYSNMYTSTYTTRDSTASNTSTCETLRTENTTTDSSDTLLGLPEEGLKKENRLGQIQFANDTHAVVYKDENFSEDNPVVNVYSKKPGSEEWTKTTVNLNTVDKNNMSVIEAYGVGNALEALGKTDMHGVIRFVSGFNEMNDFSTNYTYENLFDKYNVKSIFSNQMQTQYKCGNMKGYYYFKQVYDTFFDD